MPTDGGIFQSELSIASCLPDASGAGYVSMPSPVVTCRGVSARDRHRPDVATLDVARVRAVEQRLAVRRERDGRLILDDAVRRREQHRLRVRRREVDRVVALPLVDRTLLAAAGCALRPRPPRPPPPTLTGTIRWSPARRKFVNVVNSAIVRLVVPDFDRLTSRDVAFQTESV